MRRKQLSKKPFLRLLKGVFCFSVNSLGFGFHPLLDHRQKNNAYLKQVADMCGITKPLTFHIARHTFATTVTLTNGVPIETVSSMLGHKNLRTTQIYAKVVEHKLCVDTTQPNEHLDSTASVMNALRKASA